MPHSHIPQSISHTRVGIELGKLLSNIPSFIVIMRSAVWEIFILCVEKTRVVPYFMFSSFKSEPPPAEAGGFDCG